MNQFAMDISCVKYAGGQDRIPHAYKIKIGNLSCAFSGLMKSVMLQHQQGTQP